MLFQCPMPEIITGIFYDINALKCFRWQDFKIEKGEDGKGLVSPFFYEGGSRFEDCSLIAEEFCNEETLLVDNNDAKSNLLPYSLHVLPMETRDEICEFPLEYFEYIIPEKEKQAVLESIFQFRPIPDFDSDVTDAYLGRKFFFRDCIVVRKHSRNVILTPFYNDIGAISPLN